MTRRRPGPRLSRSLLAALRPVMAAADGVRIAVVGGVVRDRLLKLRGADGDVDVTVEGDAIALARRAARSSGLALKVHERFGTATLSAAGGWSIDLARARREIYRRPGALPEISPATIEEDLARRDFTVNAMAVELSQPSSEALFHDPFGGGADLGRRLLRVLHARSFEDDPTRALRAVRYANRLGLRIERRTRRWLISAVAAGAFETVSGDRLRREVERTLSAPRAAEAVRLFHSLGIARALHPELAASAKTVAALTRAESLGRRHPPEIPWLPSFLIWAGELSERGCTELAGGLALPGAGRRALERWTLIRRDPLGAAARFSLSSEERLAAAALRPPTPEGRRERRLLLDPAILSIRGADLLRAGIPPGPRVGRALAETRSALGRGRIRPAEELAFAVEAARRGGEGS
ncbi:MAG: hypothetical protein LC780_07230 [Acidobacteria bacterium]|nr:hypothetical protein [Acidobacteriota bacterium]